MPQQNLVLGGICIVGAIALGGKVARTFWTGKSPRRISASATGAKQTGLSIHPSEYPQVRRDEGVVDDFHGIKISDPYRWLEDPDSKETEAFVDAQNLVTARVLESCDTRDKFKDLMTQLYDYPRYGCPYSRGGRYYFSYNSGLQAQNVVYTQSTLDDGAEQKVLLDPNTLSEDGTVALMGTVFSEDGRYLAYSLGSGGSDWRTIKVKRIDPETGDAQDLEDHLEHVKFSSIAWTHDNKGFFYNRYEKPREREGELGTETDANLNQQLWYHLVGTRQDRDVFLLAQPEHPEWMLEPSVSDDGRYLMISVTSGCQPTNQLWYCDLQGLPQTAEGTLDFSSHDKAGPTAIPLPLIKLVDNFEASYDYVANVEQNFTFLTNLDAPTYRLVRINLGGRELGVSEWQDVIPASEHLLQWAAALKGDVLVVCYLMDVHSVLQLRSLQSGKLTGEIPLPGIGSVSSFQSRRTQTEAFFAYKDFVNPGSTFRVDVAAEKVVPTLFRQAKLKGNVDLSSFETKQIFATSKDGTRVPIFVVANKGIRLNGRNPTLLYGYGGFNISLEPWFSVGWLCYMLAYEGVVAVANLRGGGEYGTKWRDAGSLHNKQNVFDDFHACAEHLIGEGYCSSETLTIEGGSNGGLLVAACANQRPDLYAAVIGHVGVMDMLRFKRFTIGHAWVSDYGDVDKEEDFQFIYPYSPLHNVPTYEKGFKGQYPAVMLTTGSHDDRVVPLHSHKLTATLQHNLVAGGEGVPQRNPLIVRVEKRAGHGGGKPTAKIIAEAADSYAFAAKAMRAEWRYNS